MTRDSGGSTHGQSTNSGPNRIYVTIDGTVLGAAGDDRFGG